MNKIGFIKIKEKLENSFFPIDIKCLKCDKELFNHRDFPVCDECNSKIESIKHECLKCGELLYTLSDYCVNCKEYAKDFDRVISCFVYDGTIKDLIFRYKYGGAKYLSKPFGKAIADKLTNYNFNIDYVIAVPIPSGRLGKRGYNQSELLAKEVCERLKLNYKSNYLCRTRETPTQTNLSLKERRENVKDAFAFTGPIDCKGKVFLVVDDIYTTGSTINAIAKLLKKKGALAVYGVTLAHALYKTTID